jgi:hypothetical protein
VNQGSNLAESCKQGHGLKGAVLPIVMMILIMTMMMMVMAMVIVELKSSLCLHDAIKVRVSLHVFASVM